MIIQLSTTAAVPVSSNAPRKFRKELIRVGAYHKDKTKQDFTVTSDTIKHWAKTFQDMLTNGVKVPIPSTHDRPNDPDTNRGWVTDMFVEGDSLIGICELTDEKLASVSDVSIGVDSELIDGKNNTYKLPITHVALCTDPVIPGLDNFVPLAASRGSTQMDWTKFKKALKFADSIEMTDDNALDLISKMVEELRTPKQTKVDPTLLSLARDNRALKLEQLVAANRITVATRDALSKLFCDEAPLTLSLLSGAHADFDQLVTILAKNEVVPTHEKTGRQELELSHSTEKPNPLIADAERLAKAAVKS